MPKRKYDILTDDIKAYIDTHYLGISQVNLAKQISKEFNANINAYQICEYCQEKGLKSGLTGWFKKGEPSFNKGKKLTDFIKDEETLKRVQDNWFKKGHKYGEREIGSRIIHKDGNVFLKLGENNWVIEHRYFVEQKLGRPLAENEKVLHLDGNVQNNSLDNLYVITQEEFCVINRHFKLSNDREENLAVINLAKLTMQIKRRTNDIRRRK